MKSLSGIRQYLAKSKYISLGITILASVLAFHLNSMLYQKHLNKNGLYRIKMNFYESLSEIPWFENL